MQRIEVKFATETHSMEICSSQTWHFPSAAAVNVSCKALSRQLAVEHHKFMAALSSKWVARSMNVAKCHQNHLQIAASLSEVEQLEFLLRSIVPIAANSTLNHELQFSWKMSSGQNILWPGSLRIIGRESLEQKVAKFIQRWRFSVAADSFPVHWRPKKLFSTNYWLLKGIYYEYSCLLPLQVKPNPNTNAYTKF